MRHVMMDHVMGHVHAKSHRVTWLCSYGSESWRLHLLSEMMLQGAILGAKAGFPGHTFGYNSISESRGLIPKHLPTADNSTHL
ncbi:hypothetical protein BC937DRAFT_89779 [Endogone sp. FLAS-F59071]|nr:hypothetical protein BC937DRAFT_89779 [Endogone sp. FLAS-F59071]|eukprot:RUS17587.1 hypothetical protein BC937DRAFT_89779 [Endogone sp. FLAS-F59071]